MMTFFVTFACKCSFLVIIIIIIIIVVIIIWQDESNISDLNGAVHYCYSQ